MSLSRLGDLLASTNVTALLDAKTLDMTLRKVLLLSKLFTSSWGQPKTLKQLSMHKRQIMSQRKVSEMNEALNIEMIIESDKVRNNIRTMEGRFKSPHAIVFPEQMPGAMQWAKWKGIFPARNRKALCIHMAGTGDHSYFRREIGFANDLLKEEGMASILLQNPFYSERKPPKQFRSSLMNVSDLFVMGAALMSECNYILSWAQKEGYDPIIFSGVSMGGFMAALAGSNAPTPIGIVPILSWTTAGPAYTEGAISPSIPYGILQKQLENQDYIEKLKAIPDVNWVAEMYSRSEENGRPLSYNMMRILMDEFTLLSNYPVPLDTSRCHAVIAEEDAYVIRTHGSPSFNDVWPGVTVETMEGVGHVLAYLRYHNVFRKAISQVAKVR